MNHHPRPPALRTLISILVLLCVAVAALPASAQDLDELENERAQTQNEADELESQIDVLTASDEDVAAELGRLANAVASSEGELANAHLSVEQAQVELSQAEERAAELDAEYQVLQDRLAEIAVSAYIRPESDALLDSLGVDDLNDAAVRSALINVSHANRSDVLDALRAVGLEAEQARADATAAAQRALESQAAIDAQYQNLQSAYANQAAAAADLDSRINAALAESAALASLDAALASQIQARQVELAALIPPPPPPEMVPPPTTPPSTGPSLESPTTTAPVAPDIPIVTMPPTTLPIPAVGPVPLSTVRGIIVATSIAGPFESMLAAAEADGYSFGGTGFRDPQAQIAVRIQNCGPSDYAIWLMPPTQCHPETAIPGTSKHEIGLAIDFTYGGSIITSRSSPGFQWLAANAGIYGFINLPSEPWHWSYGGG